MHAIWEFRTDDSVSHELLVSQGKRLMEALLDLEDCNDPGVISDTAVSVDAAEREIRVEFMISGDSMEDGMGRMLTVMRTALHKVGAATPGWPTPEDVVANYSSEVQVSPVST